MKKLLLLSLLFTPVIAFAQTTFPTYKEAKEATENGYKTASGWVIKEGDKIKIGKGTMPNKSFAFLYKSMTMDLLGDASAKPEYLSSSYAGKEAVVKKFQAIGNKKTGFSIRIVIGIGMPINYWVEIDNAIESGEIVAPAEFSKKSDESASASSVADELKKLKGLLDGGAITQEEYDAAKKKLLAQ